MSRSAHLILSLTVCLLIAGGTLAGFLYMKNSVTEDLSAESVLAASSSASGEAEETPDEQEIIHETQKRVVMIETAYGQGSGFLYNNQGDIVTNAHVVEGVSSVDVRFSDAEVRTGQVIGKSNNVDVALVRVNGLTDMEPLPMVEEGYLEVGEEVMAVGSPRGLENTVTTGIISGVNRDFEIDPYTYDNVYQISAPIAGGSSGGPLVERNSGKVAGINSAGMTEGDIGFSIPINDVLPMLEQWSASPKQQQGTDAEPAAPSEETINQEEAIYVVGHYFDSLNVGDYQTAYSLLSESWRQEESLQEFRERNADLGFVEIQDVKTTVVGDNVKVMFALAEEDTEETLWYQATYTVAAENGGYTIMDKQWELVE